MQWTAATWHLWTAQAPCPVPFLHPPPRQVITLSDDAVVRVWDLRNHKCVQALGHRGEQRLLGLGEGHGGGGCGVLVC